MEVHVGKQVGQSWGDQQADFPGAHGVCKVVHSICILLLLRFQVLTASLPLIYCLPVMQFMT